MGPQKTLQELLQRAAAAEMPLEGTDPQAGNCASAHSKWPVQELQQLAGHAWGDHGMLDREMQVLCPLSANGPIPMVAAAACVCRSPSQLRLRATAASCRLLLVVPNTSCKECTHGRIIVNHRGRAQLA